MSRSVHNRKTLGKGFAMYDKARDEYILACLTSSAERLLTAVARNREYHGFTGNTQTSYACGVYARGVLKNIIYQHNWNAPPVRLKVQYGRYVFLNRPYEGPPRGIVGSVNIEDNNFGLATSISFLQQYKAGEKNGWGLVMTTGTEYSAFLENVRHLDVLTKTADEAATVLLSNFKPMGAEWQ